MVISTKGTGILLDGYKRGGDGYPSRWFYPYADGVVSDSTTSGVVLIIGVFVNAFVFLHKEIWEISVSRVIFPNIYIQIDDYYFAFTKFVYVKFLF